MNRGLCSKAAGTQGRGGRAGRPLSLTPPAILAPNRRSCAGRNPDKKPLLGFVGAVREPPVPPTGGNPAARRPRRFRAAPSGEVGTPLPPEGEEPAPYSIRGWDGGAPRSPKMTCLTPHRPFPPPSSIPAEAGIQGRWGNLTSTKSLGVPALRPPTRHSCAGGNPEGWPCGAVPTGLSRPLLVVPAQAGTPTKSPCLAS